MPDKKQQAEVIQDLQNSPDYVILNNPLAAPKFIRQVGKKGKEQQITEIYTPKIFFEIVSRLTMQHLENKVGKYVQVQFNVGDFLRELGLTNSRNYYNHIIDCIDEMQRIAIKYEDDDTLGSYSVIPEYTYGKSKGDMTLDINEKLVKKILEVKYDENFSFLKKYLFRLQNAQAVKLFPFFVSWKNKGMVELTVDNFKKKFGYDTEGYKFFTNLQKKVLDPAITEINDKTELNISFKVLGTSLESKRPRVTGLRFFISEKKAVKQIAPTEPPKATKKAEVNPIFDTHFSDIFRIFQVFEPQANKDEVRDFVNSLAALGDSKAILEASLFAESEQKRLQQQGKSILSFRGYVIAGLPKGMGKGMIEQKNEADRQQQAATQKQQEAADKAQKLAQLLADAEQIRQAYREAINSIVSSTATDEEKEIVAEILRGQSSIYANKSVDDFRNKMYAGIFVTTFISTFRDRFMATIVDYAARYDVVMQGVGQIDRNRVQRIFY